MAGDTVETNGDRIERKLDLLIVQVTDARVETARISAIAEDYRIFQTTRETTCPQNVSLVRIEDKIDGLRAGQLDVKKVQEDAAAVLTKTCQLVTEHETKITKFPRWLIGGLFGLLAVAGTIIGILAVLGVFH